MNAPSDQVANGQGGQPPSSPSGRWLRAAAFWAETSGIVVATILHLTGVMGEVGFWRTIAAVTLVNFALLARLNNELMASYERDTAFLQHAARVVSAVSSPPMVRCAGCHTRTALVPGETVIPEGQTFPMPRGWNMRNDRPYCPTCLTTTK